MTVKQAIEQLKKFPAEMELNIRVYDEDADFEYEPLARIHKEKINMIDGPGGKVLAKIDVIVLDQE